MWPGKRKRFKAGFAKKILSKHNFYALILAAVVLSIGWGIEYNIFGIDVVNFYRDRGAAIFGFFIAFLITGMFTLIRYYRSLGPYEEQTEETLKKTPFNIFIWVTFWLCWSFYCAYVVMVQQPLTNLLFLIISLFAITPGLVLFWQTWQIRVQEIAQNEEIKVRDPEAPPYTLQTELKSYSGAYGLICVPAYFVFVLVGYLIKYFLLAFY